MAPTIRRIATAIALGLLPLLASCRNFTPSARVLAGNMSHGRGQYQRAILHYLAAEDAATVGLDAVQYNLGNVYYALGEGEAALMTWAQAENATDDVETLFRIAFNRGILYYHWGRYEEAYRSFRRALVLNPSDIDAKVNLEDSLSRIRTELSHPGDAGVSMNDGDEGAGRLLDYVRRKETDAWSTQVSRNDETVRDW